MRIAIIKGLLIISFFIYGCNSGKSNLQFEEYQNEYQSCVDSLYKNYKLIFNDLETFNCKTVYAMNQVDNIGLCEKGLNFLIDHNIYAVSFCRDSTVTFYSKPTGNAFFRSRQTALVFASDTSKLQLSSVEVIKQVYGNGWYKVERIYSMAD